MLKDPKAFAAEIQNFMKAQKLYYIINHEFSFLNLYKVFVEDFSPSLTHDQPKYVKMAIISKHNRLIFLPITEKHIQTGMDAEFFVFDFNFEAEINKTISYYTRSHVIFDGFINQR